MVLEDVKHPSEPIPWPVIPMLFWMRRRLPAESNIRPLGCVKPPATLTAFQPLAVRLEKCSGDTPEQEEGIPDWTGPGVELGLTLVLNVLEGAIVGEEVAFGEPLGVGGALPPTKFAATNLSKSVLWPWERSSVQ